jgi:hypothetical protein
MQKKDRERYLRLSDKFEAYSIERLEEIAIRANQKGDKVKVEVALGERKYKLNQSFEWTPEKKERFLSLNRKLIDCFEKLKTEASATLALLQQRIDNEDDFLRDFEIEIKVTPYFYEACEDGEFYEKEDCIQEVLMDNWDDWNMSASISNTNDLDNLLELNREQNWNIDHWFRGLFDDHYISQAIHNIYDHATGWSFPDILRINNLWAEVHVQYQYFTEIEEIPDFD